MSKAKRVARPPTPKTILKAKKEDLVRIFNINRQHIATFISQMSALEKQQASIQGQLQLVEELESQLF